MDVFQTRVFLFACLELNCLVVRGADLEVALRMCTHRAFLGRFLANMQVPANGAIPNLRHFTTEHFVVLDALSQHVVALFVRCFDGR